MKKLILILFLLLIPFASARTGHINLLTVAGPNETTGGIADLYLEIKPGRGTIFIDSFPLTRLDTQISTRFANEIACDFLKADCDKYDFFYTIRAKATIVGGPSAGAAITALTISVLEDLEIDKNTVLTGTINSGGLIGPVAGINEKVGAAVDKGFTKVLIPKWQSSVNVSQIQDKGLTESITVVKVKNLEEVMYHLTGEDFSFPDQEIAISKEYSVRMEEVAEELCERSDDILINVNKSNKTAYVIAEGFLNQSVFADQVGDFYSTASYCFSANLRLRDLEFESLDNDELELIYDLTRIELEEVKRDLASKELKTISDLETYMVVQERLSDAEKFLDALNKSNISSSGLSLATERVFSAKSWSRFFGLKGENVNLDEKHLQTGCLRKIAEAEERINYAELYLPGFLEPTKEEVDQANQYYDDGEFALCIFESSKAKAEANILLTALSIRDDEMELVLEEKFEAIKKVILLQEAKSVFPILGYSYFEYSRSLVEHNIPSSLTFAEYALELSNLDMYFPKEKAFSIDVIDLRGLQLFGFGFIIGASLVLLFTIRKGKK